MSLHRQIPHDGLRLDENELSKERRSARKELDPRLTDRLDKAFRTRPGSSTPFDADEAYFAKFVARLRSYLERRERIQAHVELPVSVREWFEQALPGTVPGGARLYFQEFATRVWARIRTASASEEVPEWLNEALRELVAAASQDDVDEGYFEEFLSRVQSRIETGEVMAAWLDDALQTARWEMPVDERAYFGSFASRLHARTHPDEADEAMPEWLAERLSTATFGASPAGDRPPVTGRVTPIGRPVRVRMHVLHKPAAQWAVAASICLLLSLGIMFNYQGSSEGPMPVTAGEEVMVIQRSLSGGNLFVEPVRNEEDLAAFESRSPEARILFGELHDATDDELRFIIENISAQ